MPAVLKNKEVRIDRSAASQAALDLLQGLDAPANGDLRLRITQEDIAVGELSSSSNIPSASITSKALNFSALAYNATNTDYTDTPSAGEFTDFVLLKNILVQEPTEDYQPTTKAYVDDQITSQSLNSGSGITIDAGNNIDLGGTLSAAVEIVGAANAFTIGQTSDVAGFTVNTSTHDINATGNITLDTTASFSIDATGGASNVTVDANDLTLETTTSGTLALASAGALNMSFDSVSVITDNGSNRGLQYAADYSTAYTDRSLVDKAYVDALSAGLNVKDSARVATVAALPDTPTYNNGTSGVGATLTGTGVTTLSVDGVSLSSGDRVLVKNQASQEHNGIYEVTNNDGVSSWELTRASDFDGSPTQEVDGGEFTFVKEGTTLADTGWVVSSPNTVATIGTTAISWTQYSAAGVIVAGDGLTKTGNTIDLIALDDSLTVNANDVSVNLDTVGGVNIAQSLVTSTTNGIGIRVDDATIDANGSNQLEVVDGGISAAKIADDAVNNLKIDWGTGANQVNAEDLPLTSHTWTEISAPTDTQDAIEKLDSAVSANSLNSGSGITIDAGNNIDLGGTLDAHANIDTAGYGVTFGNRGTGVVGFHSFVTGNTNVASSQFSMVVGGAFNSATAPYSFVVGGNYNIATSFYSAVVGGSSNSATSNFNTVVGGRNNSATSAYNAVVGGLNNTCSGDSSAIIGGYDNYVTTSHSCIIGGNLNNVSHLGSVIIGAKNITSDSEDTAFSENIRSRTYRTQYRVITTAVGAPSPDTAIINKDSEKVVFTVTDNDALTLTLDSSSLDPGTHITIITDGNSAINNVTLSPSSGTIDGAATYVINENNVRLQVYFDGTDYFVTSEAGTASFALSDGNATTANGSAVDLGGTMNAAVAIDGSASNFAMTLGDSNDLGGFTLNTSTHDVNASGAFTIDGGAASTINSTAADLTLSTTTSGTLAVNSAGAFDIDGAAASTISVADSTLVIETTGPSAGDLTIRTTGNNADILLEPNGNGDVTVTTDFFVQGNKYFDIEHPNAAMAAEGYRLRHVAIESDEAAVYYRGESVTDATGKAVVVLPRYFEDLVHAAERTVQVTSLFEEEDETIFALAAGRVKEGSFTVRTLGGQAEQKFYWEVKAKRKDGQNIDPVFEAEYK